MKVYALVRKHFDWWHLIGIYETAQLAHVDLEYIKKEMMKRPNYQTAFLAGSDEHGSPYQRYYQCTEIEKFGDDEEWHNVAIWYIEERNLENIAVEEKISRIKKWQKTKEGKSRPHLSGKPEIDYLENLVLRCSKCMHTQHVPEMTYEDSSNGPPPQ